MRFAATTILLPDRFYRLSPQLGILKALGVQANSNKHQTKFSESLNLLYLIKLADGIAALILVIITS